jgi:hypothetical protein
MIEEKRDFCPWCGEGFHTGNQVEDVWEALDDFIEIKRLSESARYEEWGSTLLKINELVSKHV